MGLFDAIKGIAGAALGVVDNVVGGAVSDYYNKKAEKRQWKRDLTMWNMQNEYNSPAMQMERLRQAGLNPQLALGDVNTVAKAQLGGSASQSTNTGVGTLDLVKNPLAFENLKLATKQNEANVKQSEANAELIDEKVRTEKENQESIRVNNENTRLANDVLRFKLASGVLGDDSYSNMARSILGFIGNTPNKMSKFAAGVLGKYSDHNESLNKEYSRLKAELANREAEKARKKAEKARKKAARKKHYEDTKKYLYNELQKQFSFDISKYL